MLTDLDPVPFPGGVEAALEFAAFEKGLLEGGGTSSRSSTVRQAPPSQAPIGRRPPISEPNRDSARWMLVGAGVATLAAAIVLMLGSGLMAAGLATVLQAMAQH